MATPIGRRPRLATVADVQRLVLNDRVHNQWPPPGTTVLYTANPEPWLIVYGEPAAGEPGDWWVTTLGSIVAVGGGDFLELLERLGQRFTGPLGAAFGQLLQWPVIYEQGGASFVRWLKVILAGDLGGGVEQFQHSFALGRPGNDPDLSADAQLALAEQLADIWATVGAQGVGGSGDSLFTIFSSAVRYTEVGVVQLEHDGGTTTQADATQWWMWPTNTGPVGIGNTVPFEVACAVTLQTDVRGPRGRGRTYLPPFTQNRVGTDGLFTIPTQNVAAGAVRAFLQQVIDNTPHEPVVVSKTHQVLNRIVDVNAGRVPDSQRRRRRSQDEARLSAAPLVYA